MLFPFPFRKTGPHCFVVLTWNSLCRPVRPQTHKDLSVSASQVLGLKMRVPPCLAHWFHLAYEAPMDLSHLSFMKDKPLGTQTYVPWGIQ